MLAHRLFCGMIISGALLFSGILHSPCNSTILADDNDVITPHLAQVQRCAKCRLILLHSH